MKGNGILLLGIGFFVKNGKILYGEKHFLRDVHDLYLYRLDKKTSAYKPVPLKDAMSASTLRRGLKDGSIKLLPY